MTLKKTHTIINRIGIIGSLINGALFIIKITVGLLSGSIAMTSDAFNNLSDFLNSMITFIALKFSLKPADEDHPYGHERFEIIAGFTVSMILLILAIETIKSSVESFASQEVMRHGQLFFYVSLISIVLKFILMLINHKYYKETQSALLRVNVYDSFFDVLISLSFVVAYLIQDMTALNLDAILGMMIGVILIVTSIQLLREFISGLLGKQPSPEEIDGILAVLDENYDIEGYHDLQIHSYGKFHKYALVHVEVEQSMTLLQAHRIIDQIEEDVLKSTGIKLDVHLDPLDLSSPEIRDVVQTIKAALRSLHGMIDFHDVRIQGKLLSFDVVNPSESKMSDTDIIEALRIVLPSYQLDIQFDTIDLIKYHQKSDDL